MKKKQTKTPTKKNETPVSYDFSGGVRGKHHSAYREGYSVTVHKRDGSKSMRYFTLKDGAVTLDPDVREYFPDSKSVNKYLRALIPLVPKKRKRRQVK